MPDHSAQPLSHDVDGALAELVWAYGLDKLHLEFHPEKDIWTCDAEQAGIVTVNEAPGVAAAVLGLKMKLDKFGRPDAQ